jgi:hypothetical protein
MSLRVFAWDANPTVDRQLYRQSNLRGQDIVADGRGVFIRLTCGRLAIQLLPPPEALAEKTAGRNNLIPFGRVFNKLMYPPSINYPIPHAGDIGLWRHLRKRINVSSRKLDLARGGNDF